MTPLQNRLTETVLMRGQNTCFPWEIRKIIFDLALIPLLIWSSANSNLYHPFISVKDQCLRHHFRSWLQNIDTLLKGWSWPTENKNFKYSISSVIRGFVFFQKEPGHIAQLVVHLTRDPEVSGSIFGPATYFPFSFCLFKKSSCQLLVKVSTG